jgi:hypothetical protein
LSPYYQSIYSDKNFLYFFAFKNKCLDLKSLLVLLLDVANIIIIRYPIHRRSYAWGGGYQKNLSLGAKLHLEVKFSSAVFENGTTEIGRKDKEKFSDCFLAK